MQRKHECFLVQYKVIFQTYLILLCADNQHMLSGCSVILVVYAM